MNQLYILQAHEKNDKQLREFIEDGVYTSVVIENPVGKPKSGHQFSLEKILRQARSRDEIYFPDVTQCTRNLRVFLDLLDTAKKKGINLVFLREGISSVGMTPWQRKILCSEVVEAEYNKAMRLI